MSSFRTVPVRNTDKQRVKEVCTVLYPRPLARYNKGKRWSENYCLFKFLSWFTRFKSKTSGRYSNL